jgi:hypothetical protein
VADEQADRFNNSPDGQFCSKSGGEKTDRQLAPVDLVRFPAQSLQRKATRSMTSISLDA